VDNSGVESNVVQVRNFWPPRPSVLHPILSGYDSDMFFWRAGDVRISVAQNIWGRRLRQMRSVAILGKHNLNCVKFRLKFELRPAKIQLRTNVKFSVDSSVSSTPRNPTSTLVPIFHLLVCVIEFNLKNKLNITV
jgi:hypothetical protein